MELLHIVSQQYPHINQKNCPVFIFEFSIKNDFLTQTLAPPKNHIKFFKNQKPLKPPYNIILFINIHLSLNICAFWDMEIFLHLYPIFSTLPNLTFLTSETQKFKFNKFLPRALSPTQNEPKEPKRSQINPHLDHETAVHILMEDAACRCFDLAHTDLAHLSPNLATHLKSPKNQNKSHRNRTELLCKIWCGGFTACNENQCEQMARMDRAQKSRPLNCQTQRFSRKSYRSATAKPVISRDISREVRGDFRTLVLFKFYFEFSW